MSKGPKFGEIPPNNMHWLDWRKKKNLPLGLEGNSVHFPPFGASGLKRILKQINDSAEKKND